MIFNSEGEIVAYYEGRREEADRWGWWKNGVKWCGLPVNNLPAELELQLEPNLVALQDVVSQLRRIEESVTTRFREEKENAAAARPERDDTPVEVEEVRGVLRIREETAGVLPVWLR